MEIPPLALNPGRFRPKPWHSLCLEKADQADLKARGLGVREIPGAPSLGLSQALPQSSLMPAGYSAQFPAGECAPGWKWLQSCSSERLVGAAEAKTIACDPACAVANST